MNVVDFSQAQVAGKAIEQDFLKGIVTSVLPTAEAAANAVLTAASAEVAEQRAGLMQDLAQFRADLFADLAKFRDESIEQFKKLSIGLK